VVVAETQFGMRGIDYRCQKTEITLVIAQAFENIREAMQGLSRVGRFGDSCKRVRFADVSLIDSRKELLYTAKLMQHIRLLAK